MSDPLSEPVYGKEFLPVVKEEQPSSTSDFDEENTQLPPELFAGAAEIDDIEYCTLSGTKPYFSLILAKSHVSNPYQVMLPAKIISKLPSAKVPVILMSHGKCWSTCYGGDKVVKRFDSSWKKFAVENALKVGDCCFFELMECSTMRIEFKVIILKAQRTGGDTPETAIVVE